MSEEIILSTAAYHDQLYGAVSELDYVPDALAQQETCIVDLERKYRHCEKKLKNLSEETKKARKAHDNWKNSHTLKLAHKLAGKKEKYEARENKEEHEYVEALEREIQEKQGLEILQQLLIEAQSVLKDLSLKAQERESHKAELSSLYSQVFEGVSPAYPEHDELWEEAENTRNTQDLIRARLSAESHVVELLTRADAVMNSCREKLTEAINITRWDIWGMGNGMNDFALHNVLHAAQSLFDQASVLVREAQRHSPNITDIGRVIIMPGLMPNIFFISDYALQHQIRNSAAEVVKAHMNIKWQCEASTSRVEYARMQLQETTELLTYQQEELDAMRGRIFAQVVSQRSNAPADRPPPYEEIVGASANQGGADDAEGSPKVETGDCS